MRRLAPGLPDGILTQREEDVEVLITGLRWSAIWAFAHTYGQVFDPLLLRALAWFVNWTQR